MSTIAAFLLAVAIMLGIALFFFSAGASTIGGTLVPSNLNCEEDEVISFTGPDHLACVHHEDVN